MDPAVYLMLERHIRVWECAWFAAPGPTTQLCGCAFSLPTTLGFGSNKLQQQ